MYHSTRTIRALIAIHKAGIVHGEWHEHITVKTHPERGCLPVFVDFAEAAPGHVCPFDTATAIKVYALAPSDRYNFCDELWFAIKAAELWKPCEMQTSLGAPTYTNKGLGS